MSSFKKGKESLCAKSPNRMKLGKLKLDKYKLDNKQTD